MRLPSGSTGQQERAGTGWAGAGGRLARVCRRLAWPHARAARLLVAVLLVAAVLRLVGLDWDSGYLFHPDERRILMVVRELQWPRPWDWAEVLSPRSPLNPRFFSYGSFPLYLLRLLQALLGVADQRLHLPARMLSASMDLATVAVAYVLGRRLDGRGVGLLAAAFLALAVLPIQLSHFATVDTALTLLCTLAVYAALRVGESGSLRAGAVAGALTGLALATKTSALPLVFVGWLAWTLWALRETPVPRFGRGLGGLALGLATAVLTFLLVEPYSVLDWFRFARAMAQEGAMSRGEAIIPYTQQYIGTVPYLYQLQELVTWSLGLPLGLLGLAGVLWLTYRGLRRRRLPDLLLLSWFWSYFLIVGSFHVKFSRYMAPLIPVLCLAGALLLRRLWRWAGSSRWRRRLVGGLAGATLLVTSLYALAFVGIYLRPHPWVATSEWLCREVPQGSVIAVELWDDALPAYPGPRCLGRYTHLRLDMYAPDDEAKLDKIVEAVSQADYIVLASQRLYGTIGRLPERYPLSSAYYRLLLDEALGFRLVDVRSNYPRLGPVAIVDEPLAGTSLPRPPLLASLRTAPLVLSAGRADESYAVYDHPRTLVFKKETRLAPEELRALLLAGQGR